MPPWCCSQERNLAFLDEQAESVREQEQKAFDRNAKYVRTHAVQKIQARFRLWWPARMAVSLPLSLRRLWPQRVERNLRRR